MFRFWLWRTSDPLVVTRILSFNFLPWYQRMRSVAWAADGAAPGALIGILYNVDTALDVTEEVVVVFGGFFVCALAKKNCTMRITKQSVFMFCLIDCLWMRVKPVWSKITEGWSVFYRINIWDFRRVMSYELLVTSVFKIVGKWVRTSKRERWLSASIFVFLPPFN